LAQVLAKKIWHANILACQHFSWATFGIQPITLNDARVRDGQRPPTTVVLIPAAAAAATSNTQ